MKDIVRSGERSPSCPNEPSREGALSAAVDTGHRYSAAPGLSHQPFRQLIDGTRVPVENPEQDRGPVRSEHNRDGTFVLDERLDAYQASRSRVAVVGHDHDVGLVPTTVLVQVLDDPAEGIVGDGERLFSKIGVHPGGVLCVVGLVAPVDREVAVVQDVLRQDARGVLVASIVGISPLRPLAETLDVWTRRGPPGS